MAAPKIFVSYNYNDTAFAERLLTDLNSAGADAWIFREESRSANESWIDRLIDSLERSEWFLQVLTSHAVASPWVKREVNAAMELKRQGRIRDIIFIKAAPVELNVIPLRWNAYTVIDAVAELTYSAALDAILQMVGLRRPSPRDLESGRSGIAVPKRLSTIQDTVQPQMPVKHEAQQLFISYRRDDSAAGHAGHLNADLTRHYGADTVFMDLSIEPGVDFVDTLENAVGSCAVLLAVIGRNWLTVTDAKTGNRRLDNPDDWVRVEVATALKRNIRVIPLLFHGARMPGADDLPDDLKPLARRNALEISDRRWDYDVGDLVKVIDKIVGFTEQTIEPSESLAVEQTGAPPNREPPSVVVNKIITAGEAHNAKREFRAALDWFKYATRFLREHVIPNHRQYTSKELDDLGEQYRRACRGMAEAYRGFGNPGMAESVLEKADLEWQHELKKVNQGKLG